jgi:hypothetical protein
MATYRDYILAKGDYGKAEEYTDVEAVVLAIKNLILSKPGNFPFDPELGVNIKKYQFDILDDETLSNIKNDINKQITKYIPSLDNINIIVSKVNGDNNMTYLGILIEASLNGKNVNTTFTLYKDNEDEVNVYNEIY